MKTNNQAQQYITNTFTTAFLQPVLARQNSMDAVDASAILDHIWSGRNFELLITFCPKLQNHPSSSIQTVII